MNHQLIYFFFMIGISKELREIKIFLGDFYFVFRGKLYENFEYILYL